MALPDSGEISADQAYFERFGTTPSGSYTLEQLQDAWNLPETPNNTDIFYGKGNCILGQNNFSVSGTDVTITGNIFEDTGFSGSGGVEYRYGYKKDTGDPYTYTGWNWSVSWDYTGDLQSHTFTGLDPDETYTFVCEARNINWGENPDVEGDTVTTEQPPPQNVSLVQDGDNADLTWDEPTSGAPAQGYEWIIGNDSGSTTSTSATSLVCGDEVPSGETGNVSGEVKAIGSNTESDWIFDSANIDCSTFCLVTGTKVSLVNGGKKKIEQLEEGDKILGANIPSLEDTNKLSELFAWRSGRLSEKSAVSTIAKIEEVTNRKVIDINNGRITATGEHTQLIKRDSNWKFVPLRNVQVGDTLRTEDGTNVEVESVEKLDKVRTVYKLTLEQPFHTFYANGILTHNVK